MKNTLVDTSISKDCNMNFSDALKLLNKGERLHIKKTFETCKRTEYFPGYLKIIDNAIHWNGLQGQLTLADNTISDLKINSKEWEIYTPEMELADVSTHLQDERDKLKTVQDHKSQYEFAITQCDKSIEILEKNIQQASEHLNNITANRV